MDTLTVIIPPDITAHLHTNTRSFPPPLLLCPQYHHISSDMYHRPPPIIFLCKKRILEIRDNMITTLQCYRDVAYEKW